MQSLVSGGFRRDGASCQEDLAAEAPPGRPRLDGTPPLSKRIADHRGARESRWEMSGRRSVIP